MSAALKLSGIVLATERTSAMAEFYTQVLGAVLREHDMGGAVVYMGQCAGLSLMLCPKQIAGITATQNIHQLQFAVPDLTPVTAAVRDAGGEILDGVVRNGDRFRLGVRDPDGNSIEFTAPVAEA